MIKKVEAFETSDGNLHASKGAAVVSELVDVLGNNIQLGDLHNIVANRADVIHLLQALDEPEASAIDPWSVEQAKELDEAFRWIAVDDGGSIWAFKEKPRYCTDGIWRIEALNSAYQFPRDLFDTSGIADFSKAVYERPEPEKAFDPWTPSVLAATSPIYKWIAYDQDGDPWAFAGKPPFRGRCWSNVSASGAARRARAAPPPPEGFNAKDALFKRPEGL